MRQELTDFIAERRARHPGLHVYHYNHYELTSVDHLTELHRTRQEAVGALMGRFATREDEVDGLFRLGVFVDLYRVVRQALLAGVPAETSHAIASSVSAGLSTGRVRAAFWPFFGVALVMRGPAALARKGVESSPCRRFPFSAEGAGG
jgi:hypothetical protein